VTRIVAGLAGGRTLRVPRGGTRPTSERVREAMFSALEAAMDLKGAMVLDLFAGSGALGLEAASRGAKAVVLVEAARAAARVAQGNAQDLGLPARVAVDRAERVAARRQPEAPFDLMLLDPPYAYDEADLAALLAAAGSCGNLAEGAGIVVERGPNSPEPGWPDGWQGSQPRRYGSTVLWFAWPG